MTESPNHEGSKPKTTPRAFAETFPWLRVHWRIRLRAPLRVDQFLGGMLRGGVGWTLQQRLCLRTKGELCGGEDCAAPEVCPFATLFAPQPDPKAPYGKGWSTPPPPLLFEAPPVGAIELPENATLDLAAVLVGRARAFCEVLDTAMREAGDRGLGAERVRYQVVRTLTENAPGSPTEGRLPEAPPGDLRLHLQTPLLLRCNKKTLESGPIPPSYLVRALCRRLGGLADLYAPDLPQPDWPTLARTADDHPPLTGPLRWYRWHRRSHRQDREMTLGGLTGHLDWPNVPADLAPLLALGTVTHVGRKAALGLGQYTLTPGG